MAQSDLTRVVEPACQRLAEQMNYELVDVELVREGSNKYLRIYIDKPDGITLNDCEAYHHAVTPVVENVDYDFLEVCSPGLDRPLKKQKDYDKSVGSRVEIHLYRPVNKCKVFEGELLGLVDGIVSIRAAAEDMSFSLKDIASCKPVIEFTEEEMQMPEEEATQEQSEEGEAQE